MNTAENIWNKLAKGKKYREAFALSFLKRSVSFQIKTLRKKRCGSQAVLAERANLTQGVVSRAEDQDYGNLTFNTVGKIAGGFDMAFIGKFVPFSELVRYSLDLSEAELRDIPTFEEEPVRAFAPVDANIQTSKELSAGAALGQSERGQSIPKSSVLAQGEEGQHVTGGPNVGQQFRSVLPPRNVIMMPRDISTRQPHASYVGPEERSHAQRG